ncbi:hypothetical protein EJ05DRAFT_514220 [Pseudovirgaria hyperparasitica]|uniref:Lysine-specific metallo-endopeptidase domain-containing protein n=1 Tax=Pseudovirgaria hyperparasitica TaxID=470096 RepID=A0A6A6VU41_9PEZI|nr:uncharacterized protein EJ05DRAFT_514220 [Pseudovirgaria hyperparasitica]KAF2754208.1 hypothetical protein EJ05DRAFT_514220 [Pseudovirgaria hyperparasitica]
MVALFFLSTFALFAPSLALTYYMDTSCNPYPAVGRALPEALTMARRSNARLGANDPDIQVAFQRIFNTGTDNGAAVAEVRRIMGGIADMTETNDRESSGVRIYCNEDRWSLQKDRERTNKLIKKNSSRNPGDQIWIDTTNNIPYAGPPGCKVQDRIGQVFHWPRLPLQASHSTMSLCKPWIEDRIATIKEQGKRDFSRLRLTGAGLSQLLSFIVLHELTHVPPFRTKDVHPAYEWNNVVSKSTADAIRNAENYAFFGLLAVLGDANYKLEHTKPEQNWSGLLIHTPTIWPRQLFNNVRSIS